MASMTPKSSSIEAQDSQNTASVYDFLYHDAARVASFLSQFDNSGHLTQVVQERGTAKKAEKGIDGSGELGALVAKGNAGYSTSTSSEHHRDGQWTYDPVWANALTLLDYLDAEDLIVRDISKARIGQFALVSGSLQVTDLSLVHKMLEIPLVSTRMGTSAASKGNRHDRRSGRLAESTAQSTDVAVGMELMKIMPQSVQATLTGAAARTWCSLKDDCLTIGPGDLFLKHGLSIPGEWHIVGIADAVPDSQQRPMTADQVTMGIIQSGLTAVVEALVPLTRMMLGRPNDCYGITPLLIFREATPKERS